MWKLSLRAFRAAVRGPRSLLRRRGRTRTLAWLVLFGALALVAAPVYAERSETGNLIVYLRGGISPRTLPRDRSTGVSLRLQAGIQTSEHLPLPRVKKIRLELAYRGVLDTEGLPLCPKSRLRSLDTHSALNVCRHALVGKGGLYARIFVPNQAPFGLKAKLLAFNGRTRRGQVAVWVLAYSANPPVSFVLPFHVRHQPGPFRTVLVSEVPRSVGPWPHFAHFNIDVSRRFRYHGRLHSYLSASCPLPPHFTAGFLSLARAVFSIANGPDLEEETVRSCRAR